MINSWKLGKNSDGSKSILMGSFHKHLSLLKKTEVSGVFVFGIQTVGQWGGQVSWVVKVRALDTQDICAWGSIRPITISKKVIHIHVIIYMVK